MSTSEVTVRVIDAQPILYIRRDVVPTQLQAFYSECFQKLFGYGMQKGLAIAGNPMARYIRTGLGIWTVDAVLPLNEPAAGEGEMEAGFLHGGAVAVATHGGTYESLPETHAVIASWVRNDGHQVLGENWEWYITDPGQHPDPADWKTEVYWPLAE
ncbi:MAG: GyrI-like domain-containing protein [Thiothrix sp.]|nr:GyrI-like domain-containing protein [Thiothrix sp.]